MAQRFAGPEVDAKNVKRECSGGPTEFDDQGYDFERCPEGDNGHLWLRGWCVHCHCEERE